jgi:dTDP-L-rhamnose 4-epimerase
MRILVTGGAGLIGSHVVDALLARGHEAVILDNLESEVHPGGRPDWLPATARFVHGDVRDPVSLDDALAGCDAVMHQAAYGGFSERFSRMADVNCTGTALLFEAIRRSGRVRKVVTASSMAVYGEGWYRCAEHGAFHGAVRDMTARAGGAWEVACPRCGATTVAHPIPESSDPTPHGTYACSKYFQERLTLSQGHELGIAAVALRYFLTFGPRQSVHNPYSGICSIFSTRLVSGLAPVVYEDGRQTRDIVFVEDVARANVLALEEPRADGRVFNVATGTGVAIADFATALAEAHGIPRRPECPGRFRPMDTRHMVGDASALRALGWAPTVSLADGLRRYVEWLRTRGDVREQFTHAEERLRALGIVRETHA